MAQLGARLNGIEKVASSNLAGSTFCTSAGVVSDLAAIWERPGESPKGLYQTTTPLNSPVFRITPERYVSEGITQRDFV